MAMLMQLTIPRIHNLDVTVCRLVDDHIVLKYFFDNDMCDGWFRYFRETFKISFYTFCLKSQFLGGLDHPQDIGPLLIG